MSIFNSNFIRLIILDSYLVNLLLLWKLQIHGIIKLCHCNRTLVPGAGVSRDTIKGSRPVMAVINVRCFPGRKTKKYTLPILALGVSYYLSRHPIHFQ